jgi:YVTN family beta-propeller protein
MKKILYFCLTAMLILVVTLSGYGGGRVTGADITRYFAYVVHASQSYISCYSIDAATGDLKVITEVVSAKAASGVQSITADPSGKFVYTANLNSNNVSAFSINATTGKLTEFTGSPFAAGQYPASITVGPTGRFVYVTNEGSNTVSVYSVNPATGALTKISDNPTGSQPRSITVDPSGKFVYVANAFSNNVSAFSINATTGLLTKITGSPFAAGDVPQSITAEPSGRFVYVANRGSKTISAFSVNPATGALTKITGSPFAVGNLLNDITVAPTGKYLFVTTDVTTTGRNVAGYSINAATGALTVMIGSPYVAGFSPSGMAFDPSGRFFYVANWGSKTISAFTINSAANLLTPNFACAFASSWPVSIVTVKSTTPDLTPRADLVFTNVTITSRTDTEINYAYTIKNVGVAAIPSLYRVCIQNFFSANTIFNDTGDQAAGGSILGVDQPLAPGESYSGTYTVYGPVPSGMLYITGQIDWGSYVTESDESNNFFALLIP